MAGSVRHPEIKSQKQLVRLWFEFYKLALSDPDLADEIEVSRSYYRPWGDVSGQSFDQWWKYGKHLFAIPNVQEVETIKKMDGVIHLAVPLGQPVTTTVRQVKDIVEALQEKRLQQLGLTSKKSKRVGFGNFRFTPGVEIRGSTIYQLQLIYKKVYLKRFVGGKKPKINSEFAAAVRDYFERNNRIKWMPYILSEDPKKDRNGKLKFSDSQLRNLRRYIRRAEALKLAAAQGDFPGHSYMK